MHEIHIFELRNEEINVKKILAVINATYAVAKSRRDKIASVIVLFPLITSGLNYPKEGGG